MKKSKNIALVAHDFRKKDMLEWVDFNYKTLLGHQLICTGTTGQMVEERLQEKLMGKESIVLPVIKLKSGPLGGDQQLGSMIAEGRVDILIFFWDPMQAQPHDVDVKALLRITVVYNIPTACNRSTADFLISSHLLKEEYHPSMVDYSQYIHRVVE
jgi:methylglyoxal synthase